MKNRIDSSRQKTPWDNIENLTITQKFIKERYKENYDFKHPKLCETNEFMIINNVNITKCRYCNSESISKKGFTNNKIQRYFCKDCKRKFIPTTNTIFDNHRIPITEWIEFLLNLFNYGSTNLTSKINKNSINTSTYWLNKTFIILREYQKDIVLSGKVYIDETFYKEIKSKIETINGKQPRGLSKNQYCIAIGCDKENIIAIYEGLGKTSFERTKAAFFNHIAPYSTLIHDEEKSHQILVDELHLISLSYNSSDLKKLEDKDNPLRKINHQCNLLKQFLNSHSGFNREDLQDYLNLYCFINSGHKNKLEKVNELLELALNTNVTLKYRDLFSKTKE